MSVEGVSNSFQTLFPAGADAASKAQGAKGVLMGHQVSVAESPASLLADAAEELGFSVDRTKDYELSRRKQRESSEVSRELLERYQAMMQQAGKAEEMRDVIEHLKRMPDRERMSKALSEAFPDPTDAWAAMQAAIEAFDADPSVSPEQKTALREHADAFLKANAEAVKLGLHGALASGGHPAVGGMEAARDLYRSAVGDFSSVNEVFADIKKQFGDRFDDAMDFLFAAISSDIASDAPSMEKTHLENVHEKLALVRLTQSAHQLCSDMLDRWRDVHQVATSMTPMDLLGEIVDLRGKKFLSASAIDAVARRASPPDIEHEVLFLQYLLSTVRRFPIALFDGEEGRLTVMNAVQSAVDAAIEREDEWLASLE